MLSADLARVNIGRRRRAESDGQWRKRYGLRAGIEGTNSELKRRHGLGRLQVRGGERVRLAVYLKALACNVKRNGPGTVGRHVGPTGCPGDRFPHCMKLQEPLRSPLMPTRTGYGPPQRPHRPQHKPRPEQTQSLA